ncbi:eukaryotic translation initiation factor 3 subunit 8 N-terminus-domain-containing protein [Pyronema domesticum]|uniref:Eukaryotic translation initiation factor 3 subunit C n=1 Tax=Pyronema omphalodes (strain CBS 100304) TaxID=1076935 RepID=U4LH87_PYROM|nr:eukaryotic translation initiation factor 3 subunit 8 N-terminus-domain-containing protein [Pyronema domesticum]CCX15869.1 Similar to Eukaryotic translation initiation factor 3 subunit C; acc. no. A7E471 [Pyronema omphalodes CBS 100304]
MSRFFHGGLSDSESSSSDEEELYSEEEESEEEESSSEDGSDSAEEEEDDDSSDDDSDEEGGSRFLRGAESDDSDDEDGKRTVKSAKDKRMEEIEGMIKAIENAQKINDWVTISAEFDKLNRAVQKAGTTTPKIYVKAIAELEEFMNDTVKDKAAAKKMNAANARALNAIKQKVKRNNRTYETEIETFRKDKDAFMVEEDLTDVTVTKKSKGTPMQNVAPEAEDDDGFATVGRGGKTLSYTPESIFKHLRVIIESRGKKNTDRGEQIKIMEKLLEVAQSPYQKIKVLLALISTRFDLTTGSQNYMSVEQWKSAEKEFNILVDVLEASHEFVVVENAEEWDDEEKAPQPEKGETFKIPGSIVSIVDRLDDELTRSLQHIDPHTTEYIERLSDEGTLYTSILRSQLYLERLNKQSIPSDEALNRVIMRRLDHVYFKPEQVITTGEERAWKAIPAKLDSTISPRSKVSGPASELLHSLCTHLYQHDAASVLRTRAMLSHIYHYALHNQFYKARDMLLMSHLQEGIHGADVSTQILYNRTLVQVGLCAFRAGLIFEAQTAMQEICGTGRLKELLAQGVQIQRYQQVTPEQERLERQRQLPFHQHINLELLECAYLTCSMLLEIPALAASGSSPDVKKRVISKTFRRMLEYHERQIFTGPPENTRDHVMQAAKALAAGEWKKSSELIHAIKIWDLLPEPQKIKDMLSEKIQEEGLRTYLFTYAPYYDTLSLSRLTEMFDLSNRKVAALVSKMIAHEEIAAALDQVNNAIIFRKGVELSRLQSLALTLADKASGLTEMNERFLEQKTQGQGGFQEGGQQRGGARGGRGRGRGRGGRGGREGDREGGQRPQKSVQFQQQSGFHGGAMKT